MNLSFSRKNRSILTHKIHMILHEPLSFFDSISSIHFLPFNFPNSFSPIVFYQSLCRSVQNSAPPQPAYNDLQENAKAGSKTDTRFVLIEVPMTPFILPRRIIKGGIFWESAFLLPMNILSARLFYPVRYLKILSQHPASDPHRTACRALPVRYGFPRLPWEPLRLPA